MLAVDLEMVRIANATLQTLRTVVAPYWNFWREYESHRLLGLVVDRKAIQT